MAAWSGCSGRCDDSPAGTSVLAARITGPPVSAQSIQGLARPCWQSGRLGRSGIRALPVRASASGGRRKKRERGGQPMEGRRVQSGERVKQIRTPLQKQLGQAQRSGWAGDSAGRCWPTWPWPAPRCEA
ncbi:MAG: hypothetical protein ACLUJG_01475 [Lawsonibacter sp.]